MEPYIKKIIFSFRKAFEISKEKYGHKCVNLGRWAELMHFPKGSCDLASNFLAQYLQTQNIYCKVIWIHSSEDFHTYIKSHVVVELDNFYVDITREQFEDYDLPVLIENKDGKLCKLIYPIKVDEPGNFEERDICLVDGFGQGTRQYAFIKELVDELLISIKYTSRLLEFIVKRVIKVD